MQFSILVMQSSLEIKFTWLEREVKLGVISIEMELNMVVPAYVANRCCVDGEQDWTQNRTLWNPQLEQDKC